MAVVQLVEHTTTDPVIEGLNPAAARYHKKIAEKKSATKYTFCIDVTFEMRTEFVYSKVIFKMSDSVLYKMEMKERREQDSGETKRECVRDGVWLKGRDSASHKMNCWRNTSGEINV